MNMRRWAALLLLGAALFCTALAEMGETLTVGASGEGVLAVKRQLYALGFYRTDEFTRKYTEDTAQKISLFQTLCGLNATGTVDANTWDALFREDAPHAPHATMKPLATPAPTPAVDWPERDAEGFLAGEGSFVVENDEAGQWIYLDHDLRVEITRRRDSGAALEWFETEIWCRGDTALETVATDPSRPGRDFRAPYEIAEEHGFVLGFSDDFYANRMSEKETVGIIIRQGQIYSEKTNKNNGHYLPNLDMMAQYPDGTLAVYRCNEITAQELLDDGAINVFSFGPILIRDGKINELVYEYYKSIEPRHALGMIAPGHYWLLSVQGRTKSSEGTTLQRMAEMMQQKGVTQALNLDGGNTMALVFRGRMLNKLAVYKNKAFIRSVTSLIGIGHENQE